MDEIDQKIVALLKDNSRLSNKAIGQLIHMTGQAVGARIIKLEEQEIIKKFTVELNYAQTQFIQVFMANNRFELFETMVKQYPQVTAVYKTSGQACYLLKCHFKATELSQFINVISEWGRYHVETVVADRT